VFFDVVSTISAISFRRGAGAWRVRAGAFRRAPQQITLCAGELDRPARIRGLLSALEMILFVARAEKRPARTRPSACALGGKLIADIVETTSKNSGGNPASTGVGE